MKLDFSQLTFIKPDILNGLEEAMSKFSIDTPLRAAHFLAQTKEESQDFTHTSENLNYSAQGLMATFPAHFADMSTALHYERQPEKIANRVYANRNGNGDELSGSGWKFRGRGDLGLTFHDNYLAFGASIGVDLIANPDLVATKYAHHSAAWFFQKHGLNSIADQGGDDPSKVVQQITKVVNGGLNGITIRISNFRQIFPLIKIVDDNPKNNLLA